MRTVLDLEDSSVTKKALASKGLALALTLASKTITFSLALAPRPLVMNVF